jgi:hypothetical protein
MPQRLRTESPQARRSHRAVSLVLSSWLGRDVRLACGISFQCLRQNFRERRRSQGSFGGDVDSDFRRMPLLCRMSKLGGP